MKYEVREAHSGEQAGLYGLAEFQPHETIMELQGEVATQASRYSVQIGVAQHLYPPADSSRLNPRYTWRFLNHHCQPNTYLEGQYLRALTSIPSGSELTFNYLATEWEMETPFECWCAQHTKTRLIQGYRFISPKARQELALQTHISRHLKVLERSEEP